VYFQINQNPKVIEFLGGPLTREQIQDFAPVGLLQSLDLGRR